MSNPKKYISQYTSAVKYVHWYHVIYLKYVHMSSKQWWTDLFRAGKSDMYFFSMIFKKLLIACTFHEKRQRRDWKPMKLSCLLNEGPFNSFSIYIPIHHGSLYAEWESINFCYFASQVICVKSQTNYNSVISYEFFVTN